MRDFGVNKRLKALMRLHRLRRQDVCRILGMKVHKRTYSNGTLDDWLAMRHPMKERDLIAVSQYLTAARNEDNPAQAVEDILELANR